MADAKPGVATISGRISFKRKAKFQGGTRNVYLIKLPAPDAFTAPATVEVFSDMDLGQVNDDVTVSVAIGGYGRSFQFEDSNGDKQRGQTADNTLTAV